MLNPSSSESTLALAFGELPEEGPHRAVGETGAEVLEAAARSLAMIDDSPTQNTS